MNRKIWTKIFLTHFFRTFPSFTLPVFPHSISKPIFRSLKSSDWLSQALQEDRGDKKQVEHLSEMDWKQLMPASKYLP